MGNKKVPESTKIYNCELCDYITSKKKHYDRHMLTAKHKMVINGNDMGNKKVPKEYICDICNNKYHYLSGLCRHKKNCLYKKFLCCKDKCQLFYMW